MSFEFWPLSVTEILSEPMGGWSVLSRDWLALTVASQVRVDQCSGTISKSTGV